MPVPPGSRLYALPAILARVGVAMEARVDVGLSALDALGSFGFQNHLYANQTSATTTTMPTAATMAAINSHGS